MAVQYLFWIYYKTMLDQPFEISIFSLTVIIEVLMALVCIILALLFFNRRKQNLIEQLQFDLEDQADLETPSPISAAPDTVPQKHTKTDVKPADIILNYLHDALAKTSTRFNNLYHAGDIVLTPDNSIDEQIVALRYTFLDAEKSSLNASQNDTLLWQLLQANLQKIPLIYTHKMRSGETPATDNLLEQNDIGNTQILEEEIESLKQRNTSLEKYKLLFFNLQNKFQQIQNEQSSLQQQLLEMTEQFEEGDKARDLLTQYGNATDDIFQSIDSDIANIEDMSVDGDDYTNAADEIATLNARIDNLNSFKKLFFKIQTKCHNVQITESDLHQQLQQTIQQSELGDEARTLLEKYHNTNMELFEVITNSHVTDEVSVVNAHSSTTTSDKQYQINELLTEIEHYKARIANLETQTAPQTLSQVGDLLAEIEIKKARIAELEAIAATDAQSTVDLLLGEIEGYKAHIEQLNKVKLRYFEQQAWIQTMQDASDELIKQLNEALTQLQRTDEVDKIMNDYRERTDFISDFTHIDQEILTVDTEPNGEISKGTSNQHEVAENPSAIDAMNTQQLDSITALKQQLKGLQFQKEGGEKALAFIEQQVTKLERNINDYKMCVGVLESDHDVLQQDNENLQNTILTLNAELTNAQKDVEKIASLRNMADRFEAERRDTQNSIQMLEMENQQMIDELEQMKASGATSEQDKKNIQGLTDELARNNAELTQTQMQIKQHQQLSQVLKTQLDAKNKTIEQMSKNDEKFKHAIDTLKTQLTGKTDELRRMQKEYNDLENQYLQAFKQ